MPAHPIPSARSPFHVLVLGAGVGGLSAAAHLARRGVRVTVVEKDSGPGGRCSQIERDGHTFDTGPTLMVLPWLYEQEFATLGESLHDRLDLRRIDPSYRVVFDDGASLWLTSDPDRMRSQLEAIEPGSFEGFEKYLDEGRRHYDLAVTHLVRRSFSEARAFFRPALIHWVVALKLLVRHYPHMRRFFHHPRLKAAFTFQDLYMGLSPFEAAATYSMMPYSELVHGVWYPRRGMFAVVQALEDIARGLGVEFEYGVAADRILTGEGRATGIRLADGRQLAADAIVANADLPYVYQELLPPDSGAARWQRMDYSCSALSFLWGIDRAYPELEPHTLFLADDYRGTFEAILKRKSLPETPSVYVHAPARVDASMAPPGQDTLIAILPVGCLDSGGGQDWPRLQARARRAVFDRLATIGLTDLESHIKFEVTSGPMDWRERLHLVKGSTHGLSHKVTQMAYLRPHNRHARFRNLYFAGASTHPGTGIPTVLVSGRLAAERLAQDWALP
ncbi:MAG TPA: phytoene desaturase family protein [Anaerolineales bacterium]|nr:phytoene desaturase family protein [Anaerolineales bacterium]